MAVSKVGAITRELCMAEIGTWENDGGKQV